MKKLLLIAALVCTTAFADERGHRYNNHHNHQRHSNGAEWIVPAIVGGLIVYGATRPDTVVVQPPPVYVQPPVYVNPAYQSHNEFKEPPLTARPVPEVYYPAPRYVERTMFDQSCACYRKFLQQIN